MKEVKTFDEFLNEGMFDQGIKRAHTCEVRTEDDAYLYDLTKFELSEYINDNYKHLKNIFNSYTNDVLLGVPCCYPDGKKDYYYAFSIYFDEKDKNIKKISIPNKMIDNYLVRSTLEKLIINNMYDYDDKEKEFDFSELTNTSIFKKDGYIPKSFVLKLINYMCDNIKNPVIFKK